MKPLHKIKHTDELRPVYGYLQIKGGFAYKIANANIIIKMPVDELFGENVVTADDHFYIDPNLWSANKFHTATSFTRDELTFTAHKGGKVVGELNAMSAETFWEKIGRYPNYDVVFPDKDKPTVALDRIGYNPLLMAALCEGFGVAPYTFRYKFYGADRGIVVESNASKAIGLIMPLNVVFEDEQPATEDDDFMN